MGLIYSPAGFGKTTWVGTCDPAKTGIAACDTGHGNGLLSIAEKQFDHIIVEDMNDLAAFCSGKIFPNKEILVLDNLTTLARGVIKEAALKIPRRGGESDKRKIGIPELDDYGSIAEMTRKTLLMLDNCNKDKHIIVTAHEKWDRPSENDPPGTESTFGPELSGQMFNAAPAMFDFVFRLRSRAKLANPADAKSRYSERYIITQHQSGMITKCRANKNGKPLLPAEVVFNIETGEGSFPWILDKLTSGYKV
jgi:hypothetical protein